MGQGILIDNIMLESHLCMSGIFVKRFFIIFDLRIEAY